MISGGGDEAGDIYQHNPAGGGLVANSCPTRVIPWTLAYQVPLFVGCPRQE